MVQTRSKNEPELLHIFTNLIHLLGIRVLKHAGGNCTTGVNYLFHDFFHYLRAQSTNVKMVQTRSKNEPELLHIFTNIIHLLGIRVLKHAGGNCTTGVSYLFHDFFPYLRAQSTNFKIVQTLSKNEPELLHIFTNLIHLLGIRVLMHAGGNCTTGVSYLFHDFFTIYERSLLTLKWSKHGQRTSQNSCISSPISFIFWE